jgi:hypothetical protein
MSQYLTTENLIFLGMILLLLERILEKIAPLTATKVDDAVLDVIKEQKTWIRSYAPLISGIVEDLAKSGMFPKVAKADEYWRKLEAEWARVHPGVPMPPEIRAEADLIGKGAAAAYPHEVAPIAAAPVAPAAGNPQTAPASQ